MISNPNSTVVSTDTASASTLSGKVLTTTTTPNTTTNNTDLKASSSSSNTNDNNNETSDLELDEYSQKATRTLYIGNLDRDVKHSDIREKLDKKYGDIVEIEIKKDSKKQPSSISSYAFIQFSDVKSVIRAIRSMHGKTIGKSEVKLGFGKSKPTRTLWLDNVSDQLKESQLYDYFKPYCENDVEQILIDRNKCQALVYFEYINDAKECADKIRARKFYDKRIVVDFASKEFISSRFEHLLDSKSNFIPPSNHNRVSNAYSSAYTNSIIPSSSTTQDPSSNANNKEKSTSQYSKRRSRSSPRSVNGTGRSSRSCSIESDVDKKRRPHAGKNKSSNERKSKSSTTDQSKIPANSKDGKNKYEEEAASNNQSSSSTSSISSSSSHESCNAAVQSSKADRHDSERSSRKKTTTSTTTTSEKSRAAPSRNESSRNLSPNDLCHLLTDLYPTNVSSSRSAASSNTKSSSHGLNYEAYPNYSSSPAPVASTGGLNGRSSAHQHYNSNVTGGGANFYYHDNGGRSYKFDEIDVEGGSNNSRRSASYSKQHRGKELPVDSYSSSRRSYYKQEPHYYPTTNYPISTSSSLASSSSKLHRHNNKEVSKSTTSTSPSSRKSRYDSATKSKNSKTTNTKSTTGYDEKYLQNINRKKSHSYGSPRPKSKGDNYGVIGENKHQERKSSHHQQHHHQNSHHHNQHHNSKKETTTSSSRIKPKSDERNMGRTKGQNLSSKSSISSEQSMLNTTTSSSSSNSSAASSRSVTPSSGSYSDSTSSDDDDGDKTLPPPTAPLKRGREANSSNKKRSSLKKSSSSHHHHHHGVKKSSSTRSSSASSLNRSENSFSNSSINSELSSADSSVSISSNTSLSSSFSTSRSSNENKTPNKPTKSQGKVHKKKRSKSNNVSAELIKDNAELADSSKNTSMLEHETGGEHSSSEITNTILESVKNKSIKIEPERIQSGASTPSAPSTPNLNPNSSSFLADRITSSSTAALSSHTTPTNNTASLARKVSSSSIQHKPAVTTHIIPLLKAENEILSDPRTRDDSRKEIDLEIPEFAYHITSTSSTTIAVKPTLVDDKKLEPVSKPIAIAKKEEADEKRRASHSDIENCMEEEPSSNDLVMSSAESKMSLDERIKLLDEMLNKQKSKSQTQSSADQPLVTSIKPISSTPVCISQSSLRNSKLFDLDEQRLSNSLHLKVNSASMEHETKPLGSGGLETDIYSMSTLAYVTSAYDRLKQHSVPLPCPLAQLVPATAITPSSPMVLSTPTTPVNPFQSSVLTPQQQNKSTPLIATTTTSTITPISAKPACLTYLRQTSLQMNNENDIIQSPTSTSVQIAEKLGLKIKPIPCGLTNTNNSVCSSPPVLDTVFAAHVLQETSTNLAVQETNESHVNEQRTSVVKSEPKEVKEPLVSTPEEPMSIASTVESQKAQNLPELPVKVVNEVKPKIVETSDSNKESTATTPTSTTIDQTKSSAKEPIKIQQNKPQQDKPSVTQTAAKKVEVEEKKTDIKTASQNPQTPTIKKPSQLPVLINKPKAQTPTSTPTTNTPVKTTSSEIKSSTTTKVVSNEHAQSETTKSTTTVTSSTKKPTTASKTSDLKDLYDSEAADSTEKTSNKAPDTKKQTVVEAKKTCDNKPVVEKHNEKQVQNEKHTEKVQKPVVKTEKTEVKEDTKTPIKSQLSTTSTTSTTKTEKPKPKVVQKPENKAKEVSVSSSTKPTIKTEASQQKKAPIRKASSSESSDSDSSSSGSSSSSRSSSSGSSSSGSSSSRSSSSSSSYSSSSSASGSPNNKTSKGETAKKTASSTIKAEKSSQVEKKKKSKEVSKKKTGKTSEKEKEKGGKVSSSSKKSSSENTSKSNKRMGKLNRELISLIDSQRFIAENYSTSMYDRVKARPRGDLPEENEKKGKRKKRSTKGKKKKKAAAKSDSSDSETSSSDDESSSNLSTSGDSSSSSSKSGSSSSSDESSSSSDEDISKKSNKQKPKKKLELDSDDEEIDSKAEEVKTKTSTKKEVKETAKKTNKSVSETPSSNKKPAKTEKRKRRKSNESLFDAEESPPNSDIDASKTTKTKSKEAKNESTPSSNQTKRSRKDSIASSSSSSTSFKAATTATKPAATAAANSTKTSDAVKKRKLSDTDENGIPSKHSKDHEDTSDESKAAPKQKKEAEHGSKNQSQPTKPAAVKSKDAKDSDNDHKSNNNIGKEKQKTSTTTTTTAASKETSKTVQKEKEKDKQKETTATTKQSQSQEKAVESTENSKQMKKPKQINKVNKETYNDQSSTKSTLSSGSNSSISGALDDEPLTLSHIIKTESKNIQNLRNNKKNSTSTTTQDEENEVDQAVKKIFDATNKNASKVESRAEVVEKKLKEEPPVEEETPSSIASSQEAVMEKSSSLEQTQPLVVESKPNEQPAVEESKKVEIEPQTNENDKVEESSQIENEAVKEVDRLAEFYIAKPLIESNCSMEIDQEKEKELDALANLADLVSTEKRDMRKERSSGSTSSNSSHRSDLLRIEPTILMLEEKEPNLMTLDVLNKPVDKLVELPAAKNQTADEKESPIVSEQRPAKSPSPPILPFKVAVVETTNPAPIEISFNPAVMDLKESIPTLLPPLNQTHTDIEPVVLEEVKQPESSHQSTEIQSMDIQQSIVATENKSNLEKDVVVVEKEEKVIESVEQKKQVQEPETTPIEAVAQVEKPPNFGNMEMLLEAMLAEKATTTSAANPVVEDTHKLQPFKVHETNTYLNEEEKSTFDSSKQQHQIEPHIIPAEIINLEAQLLEMNKKQAESNTATIPSAIPVATTPVVSKKEDNIRHIDIYQTALETLSQLQQIEQPKEVVIEKPAKQQPQQQEANPARKEKTIINPEKLDIPGLKPPIALNDQVTKLILDQLGYPSAPFGKTDVPMSFPQFNPPIAKTDEYMQLMNQATAAVAKKSSEKVKKTESPPLNQQQPQQATTKPTTSQAPQQPFSQPIINSIEAATNWQEAYSKFPLTFLTPPQFQATPQTPTVASSPIPQPKPVQQLPQTPQQQQQQQQQMQRQSSKSSRQTPQPQQQPPVPQSPQPQVPPIVQEPKKVKTSSGSSQQQPQKQPTAAIPDASYQFLESTFMRPDIFNQMNLIFQTSQMKPERAATPPQAPQPPQAQSQAVSQHHHMHHGHHVNEAAVAAAKKQPVYEPAQVQVQTQPQPAPQEPPKQSTNIIKPPGKKQLAKEYEQKQQQLYQEQQASTNQQQQSQQHFNTSSLSNPFSQYQHHMSMPQPQYQAYYSALSELTGSSFPLFGASGTHNLPADLAHNAAAAAAAFSQQPLIGAHGLNNLMSQKQPSATPNNPNPIDYANQMLMSGFGYSDKQQQEYFNSLAFNQYTKNYLSSQMAAGTPHPQSTQGNQQQQQQQQQQQFEQQKSSLIAAQNFPASRDTFMSEQNYYNELQEHLNRILWTGSFSIKNETASVAMNFVAGNIDIAKSCLAQMTVDANNTPLKILHRMILEKNQLEGVHRKLQSDNEHSILIAVPYGRTPYEQMAETSCLRTGFINYLTEKRAAGIINVFIQNGGSYVVHIFPPCDFTMNILRYRAPDLAKQLEDYTHLFIVIATA